MPAIRGATHADVAAPVVGSRPIPDPTTLTTELIVREIGSLKDVVFTRLEAMDKAVVLLQEAANKSPTVNEVFLQHEERFRAIAQQFVERDTRTEQTSRDSKVAVDAALQAAKEAVGEQNKSSGLAISKSEAGTSKQIDQMGVLLSSAVAAINDKIDDMKERLTSMESRGKGHGETWGVMLGVVGAAGGVIGTLALIATVVVMLVKH